MPPRRRARQQQVGDVRAGHEEDERDAGHHQAEDEHDVIGEEGLAQRSGLRAPSCVGGGVLRIEARRNRVEVADRLLRAHAGTKPSEGEDVAIVPRVLEQSRLQREPDPLTLREREVRWHDTDDGVRRAVDVHAASDDLRIGSVPGGPHHVADDRHTGGVRLVVALEKIASENRPHTEEPEQVPRDARAVEALRLAGAVEEGQRSLYDACHHRERPRRSLPVAEIRD